MKVVLDTNVLISSYIFPGANPEALYRLVLQRENVDLVTSRSLLAEFGRVLESKFEWEPARSEEAVAQVARLAQVVEPTEALTVISDDPADDRVLEAAIAGSATYIVSGDRHLLALGEYRDIKIVGVAAFFGSLGVASTVNMTDTAERC